MKKLIVPVVLALLIVAAIVAATKYWLMPMIDKYAKTKAEAMVQAEAQLNETSQHHKETPTTKFIHTESTPEENIMSVDEIQAMVTSGNMTFDNPDVHTLMLELQRRLVAVKKREERVSKLETELSLNWGSLDDMTNEIANARQELSDRLLEAVKTIKSNEEKGYRTNAQILTNLPPTEAVVSLRQKANPEECAKLLILMQVTEQAALIGELNKGTDEDKVLAAEIMKEFNKIGLESSQVN
jgi:lipopolysaccharide export LptBFGC system permease protein LptF